MSNSVEAVASLLDDDYAREILEAARDEPLSAEALSEACDASPSTIYRRIERLQAEDLIEDELRLDPHGHHYKVYSTQVRQLTFELGDDGFVCAVDRAREEDSVDRFTRLYEGFK
jgi:DNA-binding transcriptional ArsR family regulator